MCVERQSLLVNMIQTTCAIQLGWQFTQHAVVIFHDLFKQLIIVIPRRPGALQEHKKNKDHVPQREADKQRRRRLGKMGERAFERMQNAATIAATEVSPAKRMKKTKKNKRKQAGD